MLGITAAARPGQVRSGQRSGDERWRVWEGGRGRNGKWETGNGKCGMWNGRRNQEDRHQQGMTGRGSLHVDGYGHLVTRLTGCEAVSCMLMLARHVLSDRQ